jgi:S-DNA-T family DNA segregation ATPase FtsK/SpoIIIE
MNTVITVYAQHAFKRYLLPAINNADYTLTISKNLYGLKTSLELKLEVLDNCWSYVPSDDYDIVCIDESSIFPGRTSFNMLMREGNSILGLTRRDGDAVTLIMQMSDQYFTAYSRFKLPASGASITIGSSLSNIVSYNPGNQQLISSQHATIERVNHQWHIRDLNSDNGTFVNNRGVSSSQALVFGDCIDIFGLRIVFLGSEIALNELEHGVKVRTSDLQKSSRSIVHHGRKNNKGLEEVFHRAPRKLLRLNTDMIEIDDAPPPRDIGQTATVLGAIGSAAAMALPMMVGCAFMMFASSQTGGAGSPFMFVGIVTAVVSAIVGVIRTLLSIRKARTQREEYENMRNWKYGEYLQKREELIRAKCDKNAEILRSLYHSAQEVSQYTTKNPALWSKNVSQPDFLTHRLGVGEAPSQITVKVPTRKFTLTDDSLAEYPIKIRDAYTTIHDVPICVDLIKEKLIGVVGGPNKKNGVSVIRNLVTQIAATNSYTEVKLIFVYDEEEYDPQFGWGYTRWLPHVWNETNTFRYVASNEKEAREVFYELNRVLRERVEDNSYSQRSESIPIPYYVLVLANPEFMEGELIARYALEAKDEYGLTTIFLAGRYEELPNECSFVIQNDSDFQGMYHATDNLDERISIEFDQVDQQSVERLATTLANVRIREVQQGGDVPQSITFFEMQGIRKVDELNALNLWRKNRTYESMRALIGQRAGGAPCYLDIHEKYHGPHGLVAGTTGSGKSETLQTFILSLAINFSPDDVGFFIIDYKGGGMANLFEGLPHLVGTISNLSGNQVNRALVSIKSEKNRREAIFTEYGVKDIRDYTKLVKSGEASQPVPHLIIVIDEFAEMKHDEPEFIDEVVSVSRVGRSLGIHLIMATQRPAGAVSEDIWANSRFKLCLRVQSRQDSMDMLKKADAAYLTQTGRCYLQVGNDELFELFQSGYSGAVYSDDEMDGKTAIATMLTANGTPSLVGSHMRIERQRQKKRDWIEMLVSCARACVSVDSEELSRLPYGELETLVPLMYEQLEKRNVDYPRSEYNTEALISLFALLGQHGFSADALIVAEDTPGNKTRLPRPPQRTQLEVVVGYLQQLASRNGYNRDYSLFLPLLPSQIALSQLPDLALPWDEHAVFGATGWPTQVSMPTLVVSLGLYDDPMNQRQDTFIYDLFADGNLVVYGAPQTGKSTFLQTLVYGLIMRYRPTEVNIYAIEYSARRFSPLADAPHVGGVVHDNDEMDRLDKLVTLLQRKRQERKRVLGEATYMEYVTRNGVGSLPAIVLVIDNYAALAQRTNDRYLSFFRNFTREGAAYGMFVIASAAGVGSGEMPSSMAQDFRTVVCLELPNAYDYGSYTRRIKVPLRPETGVPGRGLVIVGDRPLEFQTALPCLEEDDANTADVMRTTASLMRGTWVGQAADPIPFIPQDPTWDDFANLGAVQEMLDHDEILPLGWDARTAEPCGVDLSCTYSYLISGAKRKGKTNALRTLMLMAQRKGGRVITIDFSGGLRPFCERAGIEYVADELGVYQLLAEIMPTCESRNKRKAALVADGYSENEIYQEMKSYERICIFVEDLPGFVERAHDPKVTVPQPYNYFLTMLANKCALHNIFWFFTIDKKSTSYISMQTAIDKGSELSASIQRMFQCFTRDHKGIHFGGQVYATAVGSLTFDNHDRRTVDAQRPVGRGMIAAGNEDATLEVVVPYTRQARTTS